MEKSKRKVLITGATGLIGQEVVKECHKRGIDVNYLTTSNSKLESKENYKGFYWNPNNNEIDIACFEGVSAIINLVGASISQRWTVAYKQEIIASRTATAKLLYQTIKEHNFPIHHVVSASAIGLYPSSIVNYYEEDFEEVSETFLGTVVEKWEESVNDFIAIGIKVAKIRIGLVMAKEGGALPEIVKPIRLCAGASFGTGEQWQSWIHIKDLAKLFVFAIEEKLEGVYNGVAPNPVSNAELTKTIATILNRPLVLPNIPKFMMKLVLGEMHILLFESQRVSSSKIESEGFHFNFHHVESALQDLLN